MVKHSLWFRIPLAILTLLTIGLARSSSISAASLTSSILGNEIVISDLAGGEFSPKIAYNSLHDEYLVVWGSTWLELPGMPEHVYAQRVSANGRLLGMFPVASNTHDQRFPDVAYDPIHDRYLVVFAYDYYGDGSDWDINGRFIPWNGPDPSLLDFSISTWNINQFDPAVDFAYTKQEFLVTWTNFPVGESSYIGTRRIYSAGGFPLDAYIVSRGTESRNNSDIAYNLARNEYLVTWDVDKGSGNFDIAGVRLDATGQPQFGGDPEQLGEFSIAGWPDREELPAVAACYNSDQYMVVWQSDVGTGGTDFAIYARYISGAAVPGSVQLVRNTTTLNFDADIACDAIGKKYLLTWSEEHVGGENGIWARFAHPDGTLDSAFEIVAASLFADRGQPTVMGGRTNFLTAWEYQKYEETNLSDIHGRLIGYFLYLPLVIK